MQLKNLTMSFGNQILFSDVNLFIGNNEKVGVVGVNGSGKTTLFKIMMKMLEPDSGEIVVENKSRIEWLPQIINDEIPFSEITVLEFLLLGRPIQKLSDELQDEYEKLSNVKSIEEQSNIFKSIEKIQAKLDYWEYYNAESILLKIINGMGIPSSLLDQRLTTLSGGQKSKVAFAKLLYSNPELMLLDEPTNHLDKESKEYVINYLKNYRGSVFVISHDIDFLNQIATKILFLDKRTKKFELYDGNYDRFKHLSAEYEKSLERQVEIQAKEEAKLREIINKYSNSSGNRKRMAMDREKKLDRLLEEKIVLAPTQKKAKIIMSSILDGNDIPLKVNNVSFRYNKNSDFNIINNLSFQLTKGEKFLVVGQNGVGKSTLLKLIIGQLIPDSGSIDIGNKIEIGYYAQEHELLDLEKTIIDNFNGMGYSQKQLRAVLGRFLFFGEDVFKKIGVLSPGERSRVALAKLSLKNSNFLILDEPTNHLDPETQIIIAEAFKDFKGTMLVVSHNPEFVDNLGIERTLILPDGTISYYSRNVVEHFQDLNMTYKLKERRGK